MIISSESTTNPRSASTRLDFLESTALSETSSPGSMTPLALFGRTSKFSWVENTATKKAGCITERTYKKFSENNNTKSEIHLLVKIKRQPKRS